MTSSEEYFSAKEIADVLEVSRVTIFRWIKEGKIEAEKHGRKYMVNVEALKLFHFKYIAPQETRDKALTAVRKLRDLTVQDMLQTPPHMSRHILDIDQTD